MLETPILFLAFNRPRTTKRVFEQIRHSKPKMLFIAIDGPRTDSHEDMLKCAEVKKVIFDMIDWDCEIKTLFSKTNLGCGLAPATAINWFFSNVEYGIILEDDCLPNEYFFDYCEELLIKYKNDDQVMHITGSNLNDQIKFGDGSYFYSLYPNIWGWATWKRAWDKFDFTLEKSEDYGKLIKETFKYESEKRFWLSRLNLLKNDSLDAWDYQWMFAIWKSKGICLNTNYNLVENIGFGNDATHTKGDSPFKIEKTSTLEKIIHPTKRQIIVEAEENFIYLLHGIKRANSIQLYFRENFIQRYLNLMHKLELVFNK